MAEDIAPQTLRLPDGRQLAWYAYGDPAGTPCIYTTGTPASGLAGALYDEPARKAGVRWISPDKPGYGLSDFQRDRKLLDWPVDVAALAEHLGLERFAVAGESGGGPHALVLAYAMPERVTTTVVLSGMGPGDQPSVRQGMKWQNKLLFGIAQRTPWAMLPPMALMSAMMAKPERAEKFMRKQAANSPPADREAFNDPAVARIFLDATRDAFRAGPRGAAQEMVMFARPWGFSLNDVAGHVDLWHGTEDVNVPVSIARAVASELPDCEARFIDGAGHGVAWSRLDEVMKVVAASGM